MSFSYSPCFFMTFPKYHAPHGHGDEVKDPVEKIKVECLQPCASWLNEYNACVNRISQRTDGKGNCAGQYEELAQCQDHCIAHEMFHHIK
eukprot:NODE_29487_length_444_cov_8.201893.p1 GENE.NODE_29487_length_444_cov_8.201893~~NODE_29487_length_444_cov_8.201893.p1  ORF type:complete len:90 (-),score=23.45 NODE_29487_length_444_cov_8.201893:72-341(-)